MASLNRPVPFRGTEAEARANYATHYWGRIDDEVRCWDCDCKQWHAAATYPCGADIPREDVEVDWSKFDKLIEGLGKRND